MYRYTKIAFVATALASALAVAYAANSRENDASAIAEATVPMSQAVTIAEQHVQGKASRAEFERTKAGWAYDVEVVNGTKTFDVRVDAQKGTVISSAEDAIDHDDDHDKKD